MTLWWIGNAVFLLVVIPAVILVMEQVLRPATQIKAYADDVAEHGVLFGPHLEALQGLGETRELARKVDAGLERYIAALDDIR